MVRRTLQSVATTWLAGLLVLLPVALTLAVLAYAVNLVNRLLGPGSFAGRFFAALGAHLNAATLHGHRNGEATARPIWTSCC